MSVIDASRIKKINNTLSIGDNALTDALLLAAARNYKKYVASRYRLLGERDLKYLEASDYHVSLKYDGQLHFLCKQGDECFLYNIKGRVISEHPLLPEAQKALASVDQVVIAGELYCCNPEGKRPRVYEVTSALGNNSSDTLSQQLCFAAFDLVELNYESCRSLSFREKQEKLGSWFADSGPVHRVIWQQMDAAKLSQHYNNVVVEKNEEGLIVLDEVNHTTHKLKPKHNVDVVIVGFTEQPEVPESIRVLLTALMRPDGSFQLFAKVGTGFDDDERREMFRLLKPLAVPSSFNTTDRNHTLFTMVRPEVIIEMAFHDLISENAAGRPEMKAVLHYEAQGGYSAKLAEPFVSVLGPVYKRLRDDKQVNTTDLRLTQIADLVDLDNLNAGSRDVDFAKSEIIQREVFSKTTKGLVSVRKFISWQTNKYELDQDYPKYVFCYVDYSPGRKDPLKRVVRSSNKREVIDAVFSEYKENEIKRGWQPAG